MGVAFPFPPLPLPRAGNEGVASVLLAFLGVFDPAAECESVVSVGEGNPGDVADREEAAESEVSVFESGTVGIRGEPPFTNEPRGEGGMAGDEGRRGALGEDEDEDDPRSGPDRIGLESEDDEPFLGAEAGAGAGAGRYEPGAVVDTPPAEVDDGRGTTLADFGDKAVLIAGGGGGLSLSFSFLPLPIALATVAPNDRDRARGNKPMPVPLPVVVPGSSDFFLVLWLAAVVAG